MGTQCIIAVPDGGSFRGRYVHWDGYPSGVGRCLRELVNRDGLTKVIQTIVFDHPTGWSSIELACTEVTEGQGFVLVSGYGIAYEDEPDRHEWFTPANDGGIEWAYVLTPNGIVVWQSTEPWRKRLDIDLRLTGERLNELADLEYHLLAITWRRMRHWCARYR